MALTQGQHKQLIEMHKQKRRMLKGKVNAHGKRTVELRPNAGGRAFGSKYRAAAWQL